MSQPAADPPGPRHRGRPRSQDSRNAVLAAVVELLGRGGFDQLSMDAIAARAAVSKATIYRWWPNKVALVVEAIDETVEEVVTARDTGSLDGDVAWVMSGFLAALNAPEGRLVEALAAASQHHEDLHQALEERFLARRRDLVVGILERASARGELRDGVDHALVADVVVAVLFYRIRLRPPSVDSAVVEGLIRLLVDGLRRQP